ncbi:hypothetical protein MRB53_037735 [Persea americana]|nr:hypothetical protein MRB53_037735 [Persea americana]
MSCCREPPGKLLMARVTEVVSTPAECRCQQRCRHGRQYGSGPPLTARTIAGMALADPPGWTTTNPMSSAHHSILLVSFIRYRMSQDIRQTPIIIASILRLSHLATRQHHPALTLCLPPAQRVLHHIRSRAPRHRYFTSAGNSHHHCVFQRLNMSESEDDVPLNGGKLF